MREIYHSGEKEIQQKTGEVAIADSNSRLITDTIVKGAINFIENQPMAIVSSASSIGQIWTSLLIGDFGFAKVPDPSVLVFDTELIRSSAQDIFFQNIQASPAIGTLFIELISRKRYRVNGRGIQNKTTIEINIEEAYPNCPKYIQRRVISLPEYFKKNDAIITKGEKLSLSQKEWIAHADTFFVGSQSNEGRMDASHRGGNPGFVKLLEDDSLKIPDYEGNSMYNTLGNIVHTKKAGLLFIDFEKGETLQLTGKAELFFNQQPGPDIQQATGTGRYWLFKTEQWIHTGNHHDVAWEFLDSSPFNPKINV